MNKFALLPFVLPMLAPACEGEEYDWFDHQYLYLKAVSQDEDAAVVVRGSLLSAGENDGRRLYFVESACLSFEDWPETMHCLESRITLHLKEGVMYDVVGWSEPVDRRIPQRALTVFYESWVCCD
jgi:hypothetical protein